MVSGDFRDFYVALAGAAAALTGLLFVALSVAPRRTAILETPVIRQVRASAALLAFTNVLAVSLYGLVPGTNVGYPAAVLGVIGMLFSAAALRSIQPSLKTIERPFRQVSLIALLAVMFGVELISGVIVVSGPRTLTWMHVIGYALVTSVIVGISRAWELVGDRGTSVAASIAVLAGRSPAILEGDGSSSTE
jgi:hypothetical protein